MVVYQHLLGATGVERVLSNQLHLLKTTMLSVPASLSYWMIILEYVLFVFVSLKLVLLQVGMLN